MVKRLRRQLSSQDKQLEKAFAQIATLQHEAEAIQKQQLGHVQSIAGAQTLAVDPVQAAAETQVIADQPAVITQAHLAASTAAHAAELATMQAAHVAQVLALEAQSAQAAKEARAQFVMMSNEKQELERSVYDLKVMLARAAKS